MRLEKHSLLSFDRNSFRKCVRFLNQSDRWAMRVVSKTVDDSLRQEYSFAQMIICGQKGSLSFAQIKSLRSKFQFHALELLVIPLSDVVGGSTPSDDLVVMLADLPGLRLSLRDIYARRGAVLASTVEAADSLSSKEGWADNDRWRISMCHEYHPRYWSNPVWPPGVDFGHPRITACEWAMRWGPLPSAQEWVGKLALARKSEMPPTGCYPILTSVYFLGQEGPVDWLVDWLAQTNSPLLSALVQIMNTSYSYLTFRGSVEQCWLARPLTVHVDTSSDALIEFLKYRSWKIDLRSLSYNVYNWGDGDESSDKGRWVGKYVDNQTLGDLTWNGRSVWIRKYAKFSLPNLCQIDLINVNVEAWREYLLNVEIPMLKFACLRNHGENRDDVLDLLWLPVFSPIEELTIFTTDDWLFDGWHVDVNRHYDPISLPELKRLNCYVRDSYVKDSYVMDSYVAHGKFRFLAPLQDLTLSFRRKDFPREFDHQLKCRLEQQFPCAKVLVDLGVGIVFDYSHNNGCC